MTTVLLQTLVVYEGQLVGEKGRKEEDTTVDVPEDHSFDTDELPDSARPGDDITGALSMSYKKFSY